MSKALLVIIMCRICCTAKDSFISIYIYRTDSMVWRNYNRIYCGHTIFKQKILGYGNFMMFQSYYKCSVCGSRYFPSQTVFFLNVFMLCPNVLFLCLFMKFCSKFTFDWVWEYFNTQNAFSVAVNSLCPSEITTIKSIALFFSKKSKHIWRRLHSGER